MKRIKVLLITLALLGCMSAKSPDTNAYNETKTTEEIRRENSSIQQQTENYFNNLKSAKGTFRQVSSNGYTADGDFYISKPGKMRLSYNNLPMLIIADGRYLIYYDKKNDQVSTAPLENSPAGILVRPYVKLNNGDIKILDIKDNSKAAEISMALKSDLGAGSITFFFDKSPFKLTGWRIKDPQGIITKVSLNNIETGVSLPQNLFIFKK